MWRRRFALSVGSSIPQGHGLTPWPGVARVASGNVNGRAVTDEEPSRWAFNMERLVRVVFEKKFLRSVDSMTPTYYPNGA